MRKIKIGVTGGGSFGKLFIPLFQAHPNVSSVSFAEEISD